MFAGVLLDQDYKVCAVFRDIAGIKPLYTHISSDGQIIASEVSAILALLPSTPGFESRSVEEYLTLRTYTSNGTLYQNIYEFPAATIQEGAATTTYWKPDFAPKEPISDTDLHDLLRESVDLHQKTDVPAAALLSGGVDSALVVALSSVPDCWTVGSPASNEFREAEQTARQLKRNLRTVLVSDEDFLPQARILIARRREPLCVPNEVYLERLFAQAKPFSSVFLSGEGADEVFWGYDRIFRWAQNATVFDIDVFFRMYSYGSSSNADVLAEAIEPHLALQAPIQIVSSFFFHVHLRGLLRRLDFASMAHGVEVRVPFVDRVILDHLLGVDFGVDQTDCAKAQLRRVAEGLIGKEAAWRSKIGFPVPLREVLSGQLVDASSKNKRNSVYSTWLNFNLRTLEEVLSA